MCEGGLSWEGCLEDTRLEALHLADEIGDEIRRLGGNAPLENVVGMLKKELEQCNCLFCITFWSTQRMRCVDSVFL